MNNCFSIITKLLISKRQNTRKIHISTHFYVRNGLRPFWKHASDDYHVIITSWATNQRAEFSIITFVIILNTYIHNSHKVYGTYSWQRDYYVGRRTYIVQIISSRLTSLLGYAKTVYPDCKIYFHISVNGANFLQFSKLLYFYMYSTSWNLLFLTQIPNLQYFVDAFVFLKQHCPS